MEDMQYNYGEILLDCGKTQNALEIFTKLAETSQSVWRDKAKLQLLKIQINAGREDSLPQLQKLILDCKGNDELRDQLRFKAMDLYCRTALTRDNNDSAAQVLALLDSAEPTPDFPYDLYRAQATFRLGRLEDSARFMSKAVDANDDSLPPQAVLLLSEILDKIELWQQNAADFNQLLKNCGTLAEYVHKSVGTSQTNLLLAEVTILEGKKIDWLFPSNDEGALWPRVTTRLLMQQKKFDQSAKSWAQIAESKRNESAGQNKKSYGWWQAKFYELDCLTKLSSANLKDIHHIIEVLQSTYTEIPAPFAEKLKILRQQCAGLPAN
jgi:tetratricopeptide (TPR) repeat protein